MCKIITHARTATNKTALIRKLVNKTAAAGDSNFTRLPFALNDTHKPTQRLHNIVELQPGVGRRVDQDVGQRVLLVILLV